MTSAKTSFRSRQSLLNDALRAAENLLEEWRSRCDGRDLPKRWSRRDADPDGSGDERSAKLPLLEDLGHDAGADGAATFANRELESIFAGDRVDQLHFDLDVVAGHDHFHTLGEDDVTRDVRGPEVE